MEFVFIIPHGYAKFKVFKEISQENQKGHWHLIAFDVEKLYNRIKLKEHYNEVLS